MINFKNIISQRIFAKYSVACFYLFLSLVVDEGTDSAIFKSMGLAIIDGRTPYVDYFDHKGPILYFIDALGQWFIPGRIGIFILQVLVNLIVFLFSYRISRLFSGKYLSFFISFLPIAFYSLVYGGGNHCEEWELLVTMPLLYYSILVLSRNKVPTRKRVIALGLFYGACLGFVFYLRPNDAVSQVGGYIAGLTILFLTLKCYKQCCYYVIMIIVGFLLLSVPVFSFFAIHHSVSDFWYGMVGHNQMYAGGVSSLLSINAGKLPMLIIALVLVALSIINNRRMLYITIPLAVFSTLMLGPRQYDYYFIAYLPLFLLLWVLMFSSKKVEMALISYLIVMICFTYDKKWGPTDFFVNLKKHLITIVHHDESNRLFYEQSEKLFSYIPREQQSKVWNLNLGFSQKGNHYSYTSIFFHHNVLQANRIPLYYMSFIDPGLNEHEDMCRIKPPYVFLTHEVDGDKNECNFFKSSFDFIEAYYERVARTDTTICDIELWQRKDYFVND